MEASSTNRGKRELLCNQPILKGSFHNNFNKKLLHVTFNDKGEWDC